MNNNDETFNKKDPETLHHWMQAMELYIEESHEHVDPSELNRPTTGLEFMEDFSTFIRCSGAAYIEYTTVEGS